MRANSISHPGVAISRELPSNFDKIEKVAEIQDEIEQIAPYTSELVTISANLPDVLTVQEASNLVNNLAATVVSTLPAGSQADVALNGTTLEFSIPKGEDGIDGVDGVNNYIHVKYAIDGAGSGLSDSSVGKNYIGFAVSNSDVPSSNPIDYTWSKFVGDKGADGADGAQGVQGLQGVQGPAGDSIVLTSIQNNADSSVTMVFSDGTAHTTNPLKGKDGTSITITSVNNNLDGTLTIDFSDGTSHTTQDLTGPEGPQGLTGDHVHHISYTRSKDTLGNEVGPVNFGQPGYTDVYTMWTGQEEYPEQYIGEFAVYNGLNGLTPEDKAKLDGIEEGATRDQTPTEIKTAYESNTNTNAFTDAEKTKLGTIEPGATGDQTASEVEALYEGLSNTNKFTDIEKAKLAGVEDNAKDDQLASEVPYDNTGQSIVGTDVNTAINEVDTRLVAAEDITEHITVTDSVNLDDVRLALRLVGNNIIVTGCDLSINAGNPARFDISPGVFVTVDNYTDPLNPTYTKHEFAGVSGVVPAFMGQQTSTYVAFDINGNVTQLDHFPINKYDIRDYVAIGAVVHPNGTSISRVSNSVSTTYAGIGNTVSELGEAVGRITAGNIYSPVGGGLGIRKSAGETFGVGANFKNDMKNPNYTLDAEQNPVTFIYSYRDGLGDWVTLGGQSNINPSQYDNGTGTLASIANNKWSIQKVYYASGSGSTVVEYGQKEYASQTEAIESIGIDTVEQSPLTENLIFRGWILTQGDCTDLANTDKAQFLVANKFGDTSSVSGGVGLTTVSLQQAYNNSSDPEVSTDSTRGAVTLREGTGTDTNNVVEVQNSLGTVVASIDGAGTITGKTNASTSTVTPAGDITATNTQDALEELDTKIDNEITRVDGNALAYAIALG